MTVRSSRYSFLPNRFLMVVGALAFACLAPATLSGQAKPSAAYKAPRTPWGDADFQGNYTNLYEAGTPLERPDQFAGRKLGDITPAELRAFKRDIQNNTIQPFETP